MFRNFIARGAAVLLAALAVASCGGGNEPSASTALPAPHAARAPIESCTETGLATGEFQLTAAGCVRAAPAMAVPLRAGALRAQSPSLTPEQAMDWAEQRYPELFPLAGKTTGSQAPYIYRHYPGKNNYLGVSTGSVDVAVYLYGEANQWQMQRVGALADFTCTVLPQNCVISAAPASLSLQVGEGGTQSADIALTLPYVTGTSSVSVDPSLPAAWLTARAQDSSTARVTASAGALPVGTRSSALLVTYTPQTGATSTVKVPVNLNVVQGLIGPAAQTKTLDANATTASLAGTVTVARGDGLTAGWTASSNVPWLGVTASASTTPSSLTYAIDPAAVDALANMADHQATVTINASGLKSVSFRVTLRKRLPSLLYAMPYGIPAGKASKVVVSGSGLSQFADLGAALRASGVTPANVQLVSDNQLTFDVTPSTPGSYTLTLASASGASGSAARLNVAAADPYVASAAIHPVAGDYLNIYVHDPMRQAVYATSWMSNVVYKYAHNAGAWSVSALAVSDVRNMALSPDGSRLLVVTTTAVKSVNPDTMKAVASYPLSFEVQSSYGEPLAVSVDGRLWLPGNYVSLSTLNYFDLQANEIRQVSGLTQMAFAGRAYVASGDGAKVLVSPDYCCSGSTELWHAYASADGSATPLPGLSLWYDPRVSTYGGTVLRQGGQVYDGNTYELLGQLPAFSNGESSSRMDITPDGTRVLALVTDGNVKGLRIDIFSTTQFQPGTTNFAKVGSIPITEQSTSCSLYAYGCNIAGQLIVARDGKTVFWGGNARLQAFRIP